MSVFSGQRYEIISKANHHQPIAFFYLCSHVKKTTAQPLKQHIIEYDTETLLRVWSGAY